MNPPAAPLDFEDDEDATSKGLKSVSIRVLRILEIKHETTYAQVADRLVENTVKTDDNNPDQAAVDAKNVRRRVYDILNVLVAMGVVAKKKKVLIWVGKPDEKAVVSPVVSSSSASSSSKKEAFVDENPFADEIKELNEKVTGKKKRVMDLLEQVVALNALIRKNAANEAQGAGEAAEPDEKISLPFVLITTAAKAEVNFDISENNSQVCFSIDSPFEVLDDAEILKKMDLAKDVTGKTLLAEIPPHLAEFLPAYLLEKYREAAPGQSIVDLNSSSDSIAESYNIAMTNSRGKKRSKKARVDGSEEED